MKLTRRTLLLGAGAAALAPAIARPQAETRPGIGIAQEPPRDRRYRYTPVRTPNGWTLPYRMNDGIKEFHLVAEEIGHEFAPGCRAVCWGYNGTTPGPTIEAVEGDRVRIFVTNRVREHTTIHWHGLLVPSGMDCVGGLTQPPIRPGETYVCEFTRRQHGTYM